MTLYFVYYVRFFSGGFITIKVEIISIENILLYRQHYDRTDASAPYHGYGYVQLRFGGGTLLGEWEHNNNNNIMKLCSSNCYIMFGHTCYCPLNNSNVI